MTFEELYKLIQKKAEIADRLNESAGDKHDPGMQKSHCQNNKQEASSTIAELNKGVHFIGKKITEEAAEVWMAAEYESLDNLAQEASQLIYHTLVMLVKKGLSLDDLYKYF